MLDASFSAFDPERTFTFGDVSNIAQTPLGEAVQAIKCQDRAPLRPHPQNVRNTDWA
jgi:hypothetical protein